MGYNETLYNTTKLMDNVDANGYFIGMMQTFNTEQYTFGLFGYIIMILIFCIALTIFRQYQVSYIRALNVSGFVTLILGMLLMIMGALSSTTVVIWIILFIASLTYQKMTNN